MTLLELQEPQMAALFLLGAVDAASVFFSPRRCLFLRRTVGRRATRRRDTPPCSALPWKGAGWTLAWGTLPKGDEALEETAVGRAALLCCASLAEIRRASLGVALWRAPAHGHSPELATHARLLAARQFVAFAKEERSRHGNGSGRSRIMSCWPDAIHEPELPSHTYKGASQLLHLRWRRR